MAKGFQQYPPLASVVIFPSPKGFKREKTTPDTLPCSCGHRLLQVRCRNVQLMEKGAATDQDALSLQTTLLAGATAVAVDLPSPIGFCC